MNYFAHLVLSQPTIESTVGNLLGDFTKGVDQGELPEAVRAGLHNHRAVDRFTDENDAVQSLKQLFSPQRRRFAGIALDVYFDHLLMQHWTQFDSQPLQQVIDNFYQRMLQGHGLMPSKQMRNTTQRMVDYDWFGSYREVDSIGRALDRLASRLRFENNFNNAIEDILANQTAIETTFLLFFPKLGEHIQTLRIES
ncbi:MAG: DUF479 domain-containing protein [Gammaproteobacteria bacterium]|nr:DUF479 domain-containing protein [Gammaproteobacteria bacterium]